MSPDLDAESLRIALPKGRMQAEVFALLDAAGLSVRTGSRAYRPTIAAGRFNAKILKPQNIIEMLVAGSRDVGFAGADWVSELGVDLVELLDTGLDPVRLVAAAPEDLLEDGRLPARPLRVATEYPRSAQRWIDAERLDARIVRSYGATEVFPPDDADVIVDNTATGATLTANGLAIVATLATSSTRLYANPAALQDASRRAAIDGLVMLLASVLDARQRVMFEVNVAADKLEAVCALLPCMREPTIATLHDAAGFAVKAAVRRDTLPTLVPRIKIAGGTDVVITPISQIVP
ncbi:MAG: ATP phosphoribosyltransferase [Gemmatimonadetes bacterium]|nr:ATP phosphoribosyltransferase [Gemmatimonadota bacterium]MCB9505480.1 ATP phosphoribosyltransferase [Gemmatimonadales bacterium]MCB9518633.1 ATP phosphoribosyltransferase [Gemmatimonadales bacterium]HPF62121.1 ATP phosphoribosyltransferase [Gemmatimonadales bacterium]HRX18262.1 ATP phosphoribosyltransferase [Gemmatimonadales bacterium]